MFIPKGFFTADGYVGFLPESATGMLFPRVWEQWARDFCARALWADRIAAREDFRSLVSARL